jgi:hypothetical protein
VLAAASNQLAASGQFVMAADIGARPNMCAGSIAGTGPELSNRGDDSTLA